MCDAVTIAIVSGAATMFQAKQAQKSADAIAQASFDADMQQIKDNRRDVALEAAQKGNSLAQIFQEKQASNRALLQGSGIASSMSLNAAYQDALRIQKQDLNAIALDEGRKYSELAYKGQDSRLQLAAKKAANKSARDSAYIKGATSIATAYEGYKPESSGLSIEGGKGAIMGGTKGKYQPLGASSKAKYQGGFTR